MNIKRAKEEIKDTIEAYLLKDEYGAYEIPSVRQRPGRIRYTRHPPEAGAADGSAGSRKDTNHGTGC